MDYDEEAWAPITPGDLLADLSQSGLGLGVRVSKIGKISNFCLQNFANFWWARSRLYQSAILQENMRSTASFKLYKICILLHRCNLKNLAENCRKKNKKEISVTFLNLVTI